MNIETHSKNNREVVTRFAPSPTGFMHVGNVRTAIFAYLWAKSNNGTFILRIEDTDKAREVSGSKEHIYESLRFLGVLWDEGPIVGGPHAPYIQSERLPLYTKYANTLIERGYAYVDAMSEEEAEELRKIAEDNKEPFLYRKHRKESSDPYTGIGQTLRFKVRDITDTNWHDVVFGDLHAGTEALDDFVLLKSDGYPTYNFAHLVDDIEMGVTHVMRGQEFISSTPKYLALYRALEKDPPVFVSMPHILADNGQKKLGKRDGAKDILEYRDEGYESDALFNFLSFLGFNPGGEKEIYTRNELAQVFDINRIQKGGAKFNDDKLDWFNKEYIKMLDPKAKEDRVKACISNREYDLDFISKITPTVTERISKWSELKKSFDGGEYDYFFEAPNISDYSKVNWKENELSVSIQYLKEILQVIACITSEEWSYDFLKESIWPITDRYGRGDVLWPLRYSLSGKDKSPDPFTLLYILGKEESVRRIEKIVTT